MGFHAPRGVCWSYVVGYTGNAPVWPKHWVYSPARLFNDLISHNKIKGEETSPAANNDKPLDLKLLLFLHSMKLSDRTIV